MLERTARAAHPAIFVLGFLLATARVPAIDAPHAAVNPVSGSIELTTAVLTSGQFQIRYEEYPEEGGYPVISLLSDSEFDDLDPRIGVNSKGGTSIVWWRARETPEVLYRSRDLATGTWSGELRISAKGEVARNPELAHAANTTWIAYESQTSTETQMKVVPITDGPEPIPPTLVVGTTSCTGDAEVAVLAESGHVWISWIDSSSQLAWSQFDAQTNTWTSPQLESTAQVSIEQARAQIRATVLGE